MLIICFAMYKHIFSCLLTYLVCSKLFYGFVNFNIVALSTQMQIFHGTHPEIIEDQV